MPEPLTREHGLELLHALLKGSQANLALHGSLLPTLFVSRNGETSIIGLGDGMPADRNERHRMLLAVGRQYATDADWVIWIADAWTKRINVLTDPLPPKLEGAPDVQEAIFAQWLARTGEVVTLQIPYTRVPSDGRSADRIVFAEERILGRQTLEYDLVTYAVMVGGGWKPDDRER